MHLKGGMGFSASSPLSEITSSSSSSSSTAASEYAELSEGSFGREETYLIVTVCFDHEGNEIDVSKMRVFLSDVLFDREQDGNKSVTIPFGKQDCTVFRKIMSTEERAAGLLAVASNA